MEEIDCEIVALYVKPDFKYKGIGTKLFEFALNEFKSKNRRKMIIWCLKENKPARKFYTKMCGVMVKEKIVKIGEKEYSEVGFEYNI